MYYTPEEGGKQVYGGIKLDTQLIQDSFAKDEPGRETGPFVRIRDFALATVDLPLSAIGDTLTLPITVKAAMERSSVPAVGTTDAEEWQRLWFSEDKSATQKAPSTPSSGQTIRPAT